MSNSELTNYINQQRQSGIPNSQIRQQLLSSGWDPAAIDSVLVAPSPPLPVTDKLLGPLDLLKHSLQIFKSRWKTLIAILGIQSILSLLIGGLVAASVYFFVVSDLYEFSDPEQFFQQLSTINWGIIASIIFIVILAFSALATWGQLAFLTATVKHQQKIGYKSAFSQSWKKILPFWWIALLNILLMFGGYLFFFIPGLIFTIWFSYGFWILVDEDIGGFRALLKSRFYVRGYWWATLFRMFALGVIIFIIYLPINIWLEMVDLGLTEIIINILINLSNLVIGPLFVIYQYLIYSNLKQLKANQQFSPTKKSKITFIIFILLGLLPVIGMIALFTVGPLSPAKRIQISQDFQHTRDINLIQLYLERFYAENQSYPESLQQLVPQYMEKLPIDPRTNQIYEYTLIDPDSYQICPNNGVKEPDCEVHQAVQSENFNN